MRFLILLCLVAIGCAKQTESPSPITTVWGAPQPTVTIQLTPSDIEITTQRFEHTERYGNFKQSYTWERHRYLIHDQEDNSPHIFLVRPNTGSKFNLDKLRIGHKYMLKVSPGSNDETVIESVEEIKD